MGWVWQMRDPSVHTWEVQGMGCVSGIIFVVG